MERGARKFKCAAGQGVLAVLPHWIPLSPDDARAVLR